MARLAMNAQQPEVVIGKDLEWISQKAAKLFQLEIEKTVAQKRKFSAALSGGKSPVRFYEILAEPPYRNLPWNEIHLFWGDERGVPPNHPESNYNLVHDLLLNKINIPQENIHRIKGELSPQKAALKYTQELQEFFGSLGGFPSLDFNLLGIGANGHTASLFPRTPVLHETVKWVVGYFVEEIQMPRITLTVPVLNASQTILFLIWGEDKAEVVRQVLQGPSNPDSLPAQLIQPAHGKLTWLLDEKAAQRLNPH